MSWAVVGPVMAPEVRWVILGWFTVSLVNGAGSRGIGFRWLVDSQLKLRRGRRPSLASGPCVPMENLYRGWHGSVGCPIMSWGWSFGAYEHGTPLRGQGSRGGIQNRTGAPGGARIQGGAKGNNARRARPVGARAVGFPASPEAEGSGGHSLHYPQEGSRKAIQGASTAGVSGRTRKAIQGVSGRLRA